MINYLKILRAGIFRRHPIYVHYGITHRCNLRCAMCEIYNDGNSGQELTLDQIKTAFDVLKKMGIVYISIGGGEPLIRQDLPKVIELLSEKGFMFRVLTNGIIPDERLIRKLSDCGLREMSVSLDTLDPEKQDRICSSPGAWSKITKTIDLLSDILGNKKGTLIINTVVSSVNIEELPELALFAKKKGFYISFVPIEKRSEDGFYFSKEHENIIDEIFNQLINIKQQKGSAIFNSTVFLNQAKEYLKNGSCLWNCDAGKLYYSLSPRGELSACHKGNTSVSLLDPNAISLIKSQKFKNENKVFVRDCKGCLRPCWAEMSFMLNNSKSFVEMISNKINR